MNFLRVPTRSTEREFIIDSGACIHIVAESALSPDERDLITSSPEPITLTTANGLRTSNRIVPLYVPKLDETLSFHVLSKSPTVVSTGKLCRENNFTFIQAGEEPARLISPKNFTIYCDNLHDVPIIVTPAAPDSEDGDSQVDGRKSIDVQNLNPPVDGRKSVDDQDQNSSINGRKSIDVQNQNPPLDGRKSVDVQNQDPQVDGRKSIGTQNSIADDSPCTSLAEIAGLRKWARVDHWVKARKTSQFPKAGPEWTKVKARRIVDLSTGKELEFDTDLQCHPELWQKAFDRKYRILKTILFYEDTTDSNGTNELQCMPSIPAEHCLTHFPKLQDCPVCQKCKTQRVQCRRRKIAEGYTKDFEFVTPKAFGDLITSDHGVIGEDEQSRHKDKFLLVVQDQFTMWIQAYAVKSKSARDTAAIFQKFLGPDVKPGVVYTDGSAEFKNALAQLGMSHATSTPRRPQTNGIAERAIRRVKEGTSCAIVQSGFVEEWWSEAAECYSFLRCTSDKLANGKTPYEMRFGRKFQGKLIPFGALISYKPAKVSSNQYFEVHTFGSKLRQALFIGYYQYPGGSWSGDYIVVDLDSLESAENVADVPLRRIKEVILPDNFSFPLATGKVRQPASRATREFVRLGQEADEEEDRRKSVEEPSSSSGLVRPEEPSSSSAGPSGPPAEDEPPCRDYWTYNGTLLRRHHVEPRIGMFVPTEDNCPIPLKWIDVMRITKTDLDIDGYKNIDDVWTPDDPHSKRELPETWTGSTAFFPLMPKPPNGWDYVEGRLTRIYASQRPANIWPEQWSMMSRAQRQKAVEENTAIVHAREKARIDRGISYVPSSDIEEYNQKLKDAKTLVPPAPAMPLITKGTLDEELSKSHREKETASRKRGELDSFYAMVHKQLSPKQWNNDSKAKAAVQKEWNKLLTQKAWDIYDVHELRDLRERARKENKTYHFGRVFPLCHIKHWERPATEHVHKGRVVFQGNEVRDESGFLAVFSEQGTSASHMAAAKFLDAIARCHDCDGQDCDAVSAYTQADLVGEETWVSLPPDQWPAHWKGMHQPYCKLKKALYGHPKAGLYWEQHCKKAVLNAGFEPVQGWECLYMHREQQLFLSIYVDDFKMAGRKANLAPMWSKLKAHLNLDEPTQLHGSVYLGCSQYDRHIENVTIANQAAAFETIFASSGHKSAHSPERGEQIKAFPAVNNDSHARGVRDEPRTAASAATTPNLARSPTQVGPVRGYHYDMSGHAADCVSRYLELAGLPATSLKNVTTPCVDDHALSAEDFEGKGTLHASAARIVLKVLFLARVCRPDLLWSVNTLAREVTRWTPACDKRLHRLISYLNSTQDWVQQCFVGDNLSDCKLAMFADASFAGDVKDSKSTSGGYLCIVGPNTFVPLTWLCKKQGAISHSSSEAEIISLDAVLRTEGIPLLTLWSQVLDIMHPTDGSTQAKRSPRNRNLTAESGGELLRGSQKFRNFHRLRSSVSSSKFRSCSSRNPRR